MASHYGFVSACNAWNGTTDLINAVPITDPVITINVWRNPYYRNGGGQLKTKLINAYLNIVKFRGH